MTLDRIRLEAGARGPTIEHRGADTFLYVVEGSGTAGDLALERETMIWLEPGDRLQLAAGRQGLEVLLAEARR
jgi:redox-sensitive bicupin YhaK (pirin superfamily)